MHLERMKSVEMMTLEAVRMFIDINSYDLKNAFNPSSSTSGQQTERNISSTHRIQTIKQN